MSRGPETEKAHFLRMRKGFYAQYMLGVGIDCGYGEGYETVLPTANGIETNDWVNRQLPFENSSLDYVFSSHCLEHIPDPIHALREFHRVLKVGGFCVTAAPHQFLYEKRRNLPSMYNGDHKRFYTPARLLEEVEQALQPNSYRVRLLEDNDLGFDYSIPPKKHSNGCYEIVLVTEKIKTPEWNLE